MDCDRGPGEPAAHSGSVKTPEAAGAELEAAGAPQPQNCVLRHHLGVTARGGVNKRWGLCVTQLIFDYYKKSTEKSLPKLSWNKIFVTNILFAPVQMWCSLRSHVLKC